jgi:hypothetical protein
LVLFQVASLRRVSIKGPCWYVLLLWLGVVDTVAVDSVFVGWRRALRHYYTVLKKTPNGQKSEKNVVQSEDWFGYAPAISAI